MAEKNNSSRSTENARTPAGGSERKVYAPYEKRGYTPVASAPKNPKPPQGGTGQVSPNGAVLNAESQGQTETD